MRLKVLQNADLPTHKLTEGTTIEIADERLAEQWIKAGIVIPAAVEKAVERKPREVRRGRPSKSRD